MMRTVNDGALSAFMEVFSWMVIPAMQNGLIVFPSFALVPYLDYEYSVCTPHSGGMKLLTGRQEKIADPRLSFRQVKIGIGCNYQHINWSFNSPLVAEEWPTTDDIRLQVLVIEIPTGIRIVFNSSFSINETALISDGIFKPSMLYWVSTWMQVTGPIRHEGALITNVFTTCPDTTTSPPHVQQVAFDNDTAFAFNVSWDCSRLGSYPHAINMKFGQYNTSDGLPAISSALSTHIVQQVSFDDMVTSPTLCSVRVVVRNLSFALSSRDTEIAVSAALRFVSNTSNSQYSDPRQVYVFVPRVAAPTIDETNCLELDWPEPAHVVTTFDIQVTSTLVNQVISVPANQTAICLSAGQNKQTAEDDLADNSTFIINVLGSKLKARYRAVSPAGVSAWSDWTAPWVAKETTVSSTVSVPIAAIAGAVVGALVAILVVGIIAFKKLKKAQPTFVDRALVELKQFTTVVKPRSLKHHHVKTGESIGEGKFGLVCKGTWRTPGMRNDVHVAIKSLHDGFPEEATRAFATEACVMVSPFS